MADFGIHGFLVDWTTPDYIDELRRFVDEVVPRVRLTRASA